jgi:hypothetical protein
MSTARTITSIFGALLAIIGVGGIPIYVMERDLFRVALFTIVMVCGIVILGHAAKK